MTTKKIQINRAPVLTLWAFVVAMRQGHDEEAALTLGQALAGLNAQSKGRRIGIYEPSEKEKGEESKKTPAASAVRLLGRNIPSSSPGAGSGLRPEASQSNRKQ